MEKSLSKYALFLFDMDGTLVKFKLDFEHLKKVARGILEDNGIYIEIKGSLIETMKELRPIFKDELDYIEFTKSMEKIIVDHELEASEKAEAFPQSIELLKILKSKGKSVGIITRNSKAASMKTLELSGLLDYMDVIITREDVQKVKPDPEHVEVAINYLRKKAEDTVVIGDHTYDILSGKRAGCFTIGILSGISSKECLNNADLILSSVEDIISFL
ncbi:MAG TPA: HAD family hydrolase [Methanofastidiosum sp.]|jgi:HAD superfamily hydrolase (TIGR01549 family)|nr:HAD family hydrolase [Methanofastidiosum sp.]HPC81225.1 HAD family hydrolase [Methanofastidiosum sp.]HRS26337.1 HAD family hydrolase [Methanofastidiosum sp.]